MTGKPQMKVVIVGGSIAGLTLAHCLSRYGIDYVVLERRNDIAPQVGASVSLMPNGSRILDQLGMFDTVSENIEPCVFMQTWDEDGRLLSETDSPILTGKRLGYTITFLEREKLLEILYGNLPDKSKVLTGKFVRSIEQNDKEAVVICEDGTKYSGDVIAGADGIHSIIRSEMRRQIANEGSEKDLEALKRDDIALSAEYSCLFGISNPIPGLKIGNTHRSSGKRASTLLFGGVDGRIYWFLFTQNEQRNFGEDIPRYKKGDETNHVAKHMDHHVSGNILFSEVWKHRVVANFVAVEEMENEHWFWNRVACLGDSIHKMTPNLGQGANCAIESAAEMANSLAKVLRDDGGKPTIEEIRSALLLYHEKRNIRANLIVKAANKFTRVEALATTGDWVASMFILPRLGDILADRGAKVQVGATRLDCLPIPKRALEGTMPWSMNSGIGKKKKKRAQLALPFLIGLWYFWNRIPSPTTVAAGESLSDVKSETLESIFKVLPLVTIWTIESYRRGNALTIANIFPTILLLLAQKFGIGLIAPIYFFFHYVQSPQENFLALDNRLTNLAFAKTFLPAILLIFLGPSYATWAATDFKAVQWIHDNVWYWYPIYLTILLRVLKYVVKDTTRLDRLHKPTADLTFLRVIYSICVIICGCFYSCAGLSNLTSVAASLIQGLQSPIQLVQAGLEANPGVWKAEKSFLYGAAFYWTLLHFADLKFVGKLGKSWLVILVVLLFSTLFAGPGAALLVMWAWREELMAKKHIGSE
ncbi:adfad4e9-b5e3-45ae-8931-93e470393dc3 [Sclerotinia trifoliorum]|uniref:Adfad4e9-b5e3-45ae-8931-93e470393dc3 n=1 Tax=Sclerotinia trifoliorum TaxID=28548 RepID=A0A8H2ZRJ4_9HELO|nr:adfad4e9-b5e3-45ae-8931-93e470393dc3 [Sclerotinia trifoliorum]